MEFELIHHLQHDLHLDRGYETNNLDKQQVFVLISMAKIP